MTQTLRRDGTTWLAYLLLAFYGYCLNSLGPITPFLKSELQVTYTVSSLHFTAFAVGILGVGLAGHRLIGPLGRWRSLWLGAFGMSLGVALLLVGRTPLTTIGASFLMGLVGSLILAVVPAVLADRHAALRAVALSEANVVASLVSAAAPLMVGWLARTAGGWRLALGMAAVTPLLLYLGRRPGLASPASGSSAGKSHTGKPLPWRYWIYWTAIVLAVSAEFCMVFWSADYLETARGMVKADAAQAVSVFFVAMILGRLSASRLVLRFSTLAVVSGSILLAGAGFLVFWKAQAVLPALGGLFLTGLGVAGLYPLSLSMALGAAAENTAQASARATLASGVAIATLPLALGRLADAAGIEAAYGVVGALLAGMLVIVQLPRGARLAADHQAGARAVDRDG